MLGSVSGTRDITVNKTGKKNPPSWSLHSNKNKTGKKMNNNKPVSIFKCGKNMKKS